MAVQSDHRLRNLIANTRARSMAAVLAIAVLVLSAVGVAPAAAHTDFVGSTPAEGQTVESPLSEIEIEFTRTVKSTITGFVLLDPVMGERVPTEVVSADDVKWTLRFDPPVSPGPAAFRYLVRSDDDHPISGGFTFTVSPVNDAEAPAAALSEADESSTTTVPETTTTATTEGAGAVDQTSVTAAESEDASSSDAATPADEVDKGENPEQSAAIESSALAAQDFINRGSDQVARTNWVGSTGRAVGFAGAMLGIGGVVFAGSVLSRRRDIEHVLSWVRTSALLIVAGAGLEIQTQMMIEQGEWSVAAFSRVLTSGSGLPFILRLLGGLGLWALPAPKISINERVRVPATEEALQPAMAGVRDDSEESGPGIVDLDYVTKTTVDDADSIVAKEHWEPGFVWALAVFASAVLVSSHLFDGHSLSSENRLITVFSTVVHVAAAAVWCGGVVMLGAVLRLRQRSGRDVGGWDLAARFSVIASVALLAVAVAGAALAYTVVDSVEELWTTPWGQLLLIKLGFVAVGVVIGAYNRQVLLRRVNTATADVTALLRKAMTVEAVVLVAAAVVTGILVGAAS